VRRVSGTINRVLPGLLLVASFLIAFLILLVIGGSMTRPRLFIYYWPVMQTDLLHLPRSARFVRPEGFLNLQVVTSRIRPEQRPSNVTWRITALNGRIECQDVTDLRVAEDLHWHSGASMANLFGSKSCGGERQTGQKVLTIHSAINHGPSHLYSVNMYYLSSPTLYDRLRCWADLCVVERLPDY